MAVSGAAYGQGAWPERTVSLVVPAAAGGSADVLARRIAIALERDPGQPFVVLNRPGGNNLIGTRVVVTAKPDGYTLLAHGVGAHVVPTKETPDAFDPDKDFSHLVYIGGIPAALVASKAFPADDVDGLI